MKPRFPHLRTATSARLLIVASFSRLLAEEKVSFNRDIRPIFSDTCFQCHGPDEAKRKSGVRFDQRESATARAKSGDFPIVPGKPEESEVMVRLTTKDPDDLMPPSKLHKELTPKQIETVRRWIAEGAFTKGIGRSQTGAATRAGNPQSAIRDPQSHRRLHRGPARGGAARTFAGSRSRDAHPPRVARPDRAPADRGGGGCLSRG